MVSTSVPPIPSSKKNVRGVCFLLAVITLIGFLYVGTISIFLKEIAFTLGIIGIVIVACFHFFFFMMMMAFFKCVATDPGSVPLNWGFYMGDDTKRRRYCKVCNVWKPDRTHHCSACGRCVLNMDHHCPWINNCVGFYNRKYFIQLLIYALICLSFVLVLGVRHMVLLSLQQFPLDYETIDPIVIGEFIYMFLILFLCAVMMFALIPFSRFHIKLVMKNTTTIENMSSECRGRSRFDLGLERNLQQVFGGNVCCWLAPCSTYSSGPLGDGVRWNMHYMSAAEDMSI